MMKKCELCKSPATAYCESDDASLCWDCDGKVHGANFLVARHSRVLLCQSCQSLTPWKAAGSKLGHTFSTCLTCADEEDRQQRRPEENQEESEGDNDGGGGEEDSTDSEEDLEGVGGACDDDDNQVVPPWSSPSTPPPPPPSSSSSTTISSGEFVRNVNVSLKRARQSSTDLSSLIQNDINRSSYQRRKHGDLGLTRTQAGGDDGDTAATLVDPWRPLMNRKMSPDRAVQVGSRSGR